MARLLGLRNVCTNGKEWRYVFFYDIDNNPETPTKPDWEWVDNLMKTCECSYIAYSTKHGWHVVGLTPLDLQDWHILMRMFMDKYPNYFSGTTIRLSRKKKEVQKFIKANYTNGEVIDNLLSIYEKRFGLTDASPSAPGERKWKLVFEHYSTSKE